MASHLQYGISPFCWFISLIPEVKFLIAAAGCARLCRIGAAVLTMLTKQLEPVLGTQELMGVATSVLRLTRGRLAGGEGKAFGSHLLTMTGQWTTSAPIPRVSWVRLAWAVVRQ